jgi:hypothetical protein
VFELSELVSENLNDKNSKKDDQNNEKIEKESVSGKIAQDNSNNFDNSI